MGGPGGPAFELRSDPLPPLPPPLEEAAFRIIAESMTNVSRHAGAAHCAVELARSNGDLRVGVTDDGSGVAPTAVAGHGLASMRQRALDVGGTFHLDAVPPHGTRVTALLPLEPA
jgi:signal transduction histidine kinase